MLSKELVNRLKDCKTDKDLKREFKKIASKTPDKYFPTNELKGLGYMRKQCENCGTFFWTVLQDRTVCGDPICSGGFNITKNNPIKVKLSYKEVWNKIVEILEPRGYMPIKRYPCVARWNPTSEFTIASISAFQPYVITGEVEPPAKKLIIPQFCLRFNDIENVGLTGSHNCGFTMIGQHVFVPPEEWNQGQLFLDIHAFIYEGVGLAKEEITIHEDSWAGGGSFGCSLEFFSRGVELFNQVYTMFEQTSEGPRELSLKVLDMGMGQERVAWFSQGTPNIYEATFPSVLSKLRKITNICLDLDLYNKFSKYSAYLNADEVEDMDSAWQKVANELNEDVHELKSKILPMTALYSIAEHSRTLLFAINDGKLPSNVGGGFNLRAIFRRAIGFIDHFNWDIDIADICELHAQELVDLYPEVSEHLDDIREILEVEKQKYYKTKKKAVKLLDKTLKEGSISTETLITLYDSKGIDPDMVRHAARNYNVDVKIPDNFFSLVVERHEIKEQIHATKKEIELDLKGIPETKSLYYYDYQNIENEANVLKVIGKYVVLDQSVVYPTSGGQLHDIGTINDQAFDDAFKQGNHVIHVLKEKPKFKRGDLVKVKVNKEWRLQLSQHHTATHIINAAARKVLGNHINQAGAKKSDKESHLDITHYAKIPYDKLKLIEQYSNEIVDKAIHLNLSFILRSEAERKYGMTIYQGGAVPGKFLRIVEIPGIDVEACGGTHLNNTSEAGSIKIINSQKIQDGIVRLTFTAGQATKNLEEKDSLIIKQLTKFFKVKAQNLPARIEELANKWKNLNKALKSGKFSNKDLILESKGNYQGEIINELCLIMNTTKSNLLSKIKKMYGEWKIAQNKLDKMTTLFDDSFIEELIHKAISLQKYRFIAHIFENLTLNDLKNFSIKLVNKSNDLITVLITRNEDGILIIGMLGEQPKNDKIFHMGDLIKNISQKFNGKGGGSLDFGQAFIADPKTPLDTVLNEVHEKLKDIN
jgi:alanyl-tRNA synthetase